MDDYSVKETADKRVKDFRNCFEAAMDVETAIGCCGMSDMDATVQHAARKLWTMWQERFERA